MDERFRFFSRCNDPAVRIHAGSVAKLGPRRAWLFAGEGIAARLGRELCAADALATKEFFESVELFERVRRHVRAPRVVDLCCGHGFTGMLFALLERRVERVTLVDRARPGSHDAILEAVARVGPWVRAKVRFVERELRDAKDLVAPGASVLAVHACGARTDRALDLALAARGAVAVMPCCASRRAYEGSSALLQALGVATTHDVARTLRLESAGYRVAWKHVPPEITPRNRILLGVPNGSPTCVPRAGAP